jgi:hypothetical protein
MSNQADIDTKALLFGHMLSGALAGTTEHCAMFPLVGCCNLTPGASTRLLAQSYRQYE